MKRARFDSSQVSPPSELAEHQPKVSRKIRACQACQNRKIKCDLDPGQEQCARCARLGLKCVVNKSLQTLLDSENEWKKNIEAQMQSLQAALCEVQRALNMPHPVPNQLPGLQASNGFRGGGHGPSMQPPPQARADGPVPVRPTGMARENSVEPEVQETDDQAMVNAPMASLYEVTKLRNVRSDPWARMHRPQSRSRKPDFISQGKASSSLLTAAILAVTALHAQDDGTSFDVCYPIFLELVSQAMFDRYHSLDDVRGLCIGAFYLSDLSWKLSGLAVRIATELNLHQFCAMAIGDRPEYVEEARLWYLLYVCDHHFSIAYGRPPCD
ncbi:hypothetical protein J3458_004291 [Metarhizium acridum]|uniref:uncharacterized protein n=1 Tax=Metarhizium acridum TaxID=92637 RepID=UPI001C6AF66F|nr:hypothetical protein J3458_004291 [Metarhizium acridum]